MKDTFTTIATFPYSSEAQIVKGKLQSEGIQVYLADEYTIDSDPLISQAIGGVKIQVLTTQKEEAISILKDIHSFSVDENGEAIICPNCESKNIEYFSTISDIKSLFFFLFGFLFALLPFYTKYTYRCESCKTDFNL